MCVWCLDTGRVWLQAQFGLPSLPHAESLPPRLQNESLRGPGTLSPYRGCYRLPRACSQAMDVPKCGSPKAPQEHVSSSLPGPLRLSPPDQPPRPPRPSPIREGKPSFPPGQPLCGLSSTSHPLLCCPPLRAPWVSGLPPHSHSPLHNQF